jgi:hypothetical protein
VEGIHEIVPDLSLVDDRPIRIPQDRHD